MFGLRCKITKTMFPADYRKVTIMLRIVQPFLIASSSENFKVQIVFLPKKCKI